MNRVDHLSYTHHLGVVTLQKHDRGVTLMVSDPMELEQEQWDRAIDEAYRLGYELNSDEPAETLGIVEFWDLDPIERAA